VPQRAWSDKRERQYEHIEEPAEKCGSGEDRVQEIAARTVHKDRAGARESQQASPGPHRRRLTGAPRRQAVALRQPGPYQGPALRGRQAQAHRRLFDHVEEAAAGRCR